MGFDFRPISDALDVLGGLAGVLLLGGLCVMVAMIVIKKIDERSQR